MHRAVTGPWASLRRRACGGLVLALLGPGGCVEPFPVPPGTGTSGSTSGETSTGSVAPPGGTSTSDGTAAGSDTALDSSDGGSRGSSSESGPDSSTGGGSPLGARCTDPAQCSSGACFTVGPLGGVCSECDEDADCADSTGFGCNFGNPLTGTPAVCSDSGDVGESCESQDACADGLLCPVLIDVPGILSASTCSVCEADADCMGGQLCSPNYDIANIGGNFECVEPMSVPNGEGCSVDGMSGIAQCMSGHCAPASLMGIPVIAVCSECSEDVDCSDGPCQLPEVVIKGEVASLVPGGCV